MDFTVSMAQQFKDWLGTVNDPAFGKYVLEFMSKNECMIYGTNSPQLLAETLVQVFTFADAMPDGIDGLKNMGANEIQQHVNDMRNNPNLDKTSIQRVSNYWLKAIEGYTKQKSNQLTGDANLKMKATKDLQGRYFRDKDSPQRGVFRSIFDTSPFRLDPLVEGMAADPQFFEGKREKARSVSTHGRIQTPLQKLNDFAVRRACKFLLYESIRKGKKIVYMLDDLDMEMVAFMMEGSRIPEFARLTGGSSDGKVPVCTTEIREIFRRWDFLKGKVQFFYGLMQSAPPWEDSRYVDKWGVYAAYRASKALELSTLSMGDRETFKLASKAQGVNAVRRYLQANPSKYFNEQIVHFTTNQPEGIRVQ